MADKYLKQFEILIIKADQDLASADYLTNMHPLPNEIIYFHLQQATEKYIKSLLDYNKIKFPHTHDIQELLQIIHENNINIIDSCKELIKLTDYAVEGRYSVLSSELSDIKKMLKEVEKLKEFIKVNIFKTK